MTRQGHALAALATAAVVGLQVLLPRVFSVVLWYHLGFFTVSVAMLGLAGGSALIARRVARGAAPGGDLPLARLAALASLAIPAVLALAVRLPVDPTALLESPPAAALLVLLALLVGLPFVLLGCLVCATLDAARERPGGLYAATFAGGAAGALLALAAMEWWGAPRAAGVLAALPLVGALLAAPRAPATLAGVLVCACTLLLPAQVLPFASRKHFPIVAPEHVLAEEWNAFSHVLFYENPEHHGLWAVAPSYTGPLPETRAAAIDAWAITPYLRRAPHEDEAPFFGAYPPSVFFEGAAPGFTALVIGAGGGIDVQAALAAGASHVTAVEINPLIVEAARGQFSEWTGGLYDDPRVEVVVAEGRAFLERETRRWDRIVLSGVDTFAATEAGTFALSENHLYTLEGMAACLSRLEPGGVVGLTRWWFTPPRQTLRLALTAAHVLRAAGAPDPGLHLVIGHSGFNSLVLIKAERFIPTEVAGLMEGFARRGIEPVYAQQVPSHPDFVHALALRDPAPFIAAWPYRIDPATDDAPFFFETSRLANLFRGEGDWIRDRLGGQEVLVVTLAVLLLLCIPVAWFGGGLRLPPREAAGFAALGAAYMLVEVPTLQRLALLLGHPVLAVAVVLVALLAWSGGGALLADRIAARRLVPLTLGTAVLVVLVLVFAQDALASSLRTASQAVRIAAVIGLLAPPGLLMGMPFPMALRALAGTDPALVPRAFLWNGLASVLVAPVAVMLAMAEGFRATLFVAALCYAVAAFLFRRSRSA
ncbi:MAG: spermidine synthase [Planctomycetota bacterium]|jgi:hypothetical protein